MRARRFGFAILGFLVLAFPVRARDQIHLVSSSTVFPFAAVVAEHFGKTSGFVAPVIESTGSGGGLKQFCAGISAESPDLVGTSRRITGSETRTCATNGVTDITEITIGFDGIVLANAKTTKLYALTRRQLYLAITKSVPSEGKLVPNPYTRWSDIDPALPKDEIMVFGPAPNHGTRDVLIELVMDVGCASFPETRALAPDARRSACEHVREDGHFIEVSENYAILLRKVAGEPRALGILPFSYLNQNGDKLQAVPLEGQVPSYDNIYNGSYLLSRPLFIYVKNAHIAVTAGIKEYLMEFTSDKAWGSDGYLAEAGLISLPDAVRKSERAKVLSLPALAH